VSYYGIALTVLWGTVLPWFLDFISDYSIEHMWKTAVLVAMIVGYVMLTIATWHMTRFLREALMGLYCVIWLIEALILFLIWKSCSAEPHWHDIRVIWTVFGLIIAIVVVLYFEITNFIQRVITKPKTVPVHEQNSPACQLGSVV
jgi:thiol:disulfide interchange protein